MDIPFAASTRTDDCALLTKHSKTMSWWASLYDRCSPIVYSIAHQVLPCPSDDTEEILQDVFMQLWRSNPGCPGFAAANFSAWIAVVPRNRSIDVLRKRHLSVPTEDLLLVSPSKLVNNTKRNLMCEKARMITVNLPTDQRKALEIAFFEG
jgi:RNA polymerase sigma-70 factor (ECF subfamily)